ncbi:proline-serine-threonine phosphatase-interacting protein 2-like, partial [Sinocyclocheilus grahami]|uniref:proline-serine-threonine phosphatase-interacting protein 2-like n=1 Tax=Sinocyclocheilus grahami TaxID=75366 RepID=UPI0007AC6DF1
MNTLKRSLDVFKLQTESVSLSHLHLAQTMREEAKKLEDFREKQKEARKKVEQHMDTLHKQKAAQYKKTAEAKKTYEQKCRDKEEAEQNMNRNATTSSSKQQEK